MMSLKALGFLKQRKRAWVGTFFLLCLSTYALFAQAQSGSAWIDPTHLTKTIFPASKGAETRTIAPLSSAAELAVQPSLQVGQPRVSGRRSDKRGKKATPLMLKTMVLAAHRFQVDAYLVKAVIHAESAFDPQARSPKNAIGLMQVLPSTARDLGLTAQPTASVEQLLTDPRVSIVVGTKYLAEQLARFGGNVELALAAYNAGPGAVIRAGHKVPNYPETKVYVQRVKSLAHIYRQRQSLLEVQS